MKGERQMLWTLTDPDCLQCLRTINSEARIYELIQVDDYTHIEKGCRIARGTVCLDHYGAEELLQLLKTYGYLSLSDFEEQNNGLDWSLVAEMVFETQASSYETEGVYVSYMDAGRAVEQITGLDLKTFYQEACVR